MFREQLAFRRVRVAAENKRPHSHVQVAVQLCQHLFGIADDGAAAAAAREADAGPDVRFDEEIGVGAGAEFVLAQDAGALGVEGAGAYRRAP